MSIDKLIDQLAFGQTGVRVSSCLGMFLSPEAVCLAQSHVAGGKAVVDALVRIPLSPPAGGAIRATATASSGTLNADFLADNDKIGPLLREAVSQTRWNTKHVFVTLAYQIGLLRYFTMPAVERRFWKSSVPLEAKKYIPIAFDQLNYDFQVIPLEPDPGGRSRQGALVAVTQKKNIASINELLEGAGLNMVGIEVAPCSVMRLWDLLEKGKDGRPYCQVHFDAGSIRILVADKGIPVFFRDVFLGEEPAVSDLRRLDLGGCIGFAQKQLGVGAMSEVRLSGSGVELAAWQEAIAQEVAAPVEVQDIAGMLAIPSGDWGSYAAIGASARFTAPSPTVLDVGQVGKVSADERRTARDIFIVSAAVALWFLSCGLIQGFLCRRDLKELARYKRPPDIEMAFAGKPVAAIEEMIASLRAQVEVAQGLQAQSSKATAILKDVIDSLPDKVWLTRISLSNPILKKNPAGDQEMSLAGHCVGPTPGDERDLAYEFKERLLKSPVVGKFFSDIQISYAAKPIPENTNQTLDPDALARMVEERTAFEITAKAGK